jgi:hypothetical protein
MEMDYSNSNKSTIKYLTYLQIIVSDAIQIILTIVYHLQKEDFRLLSKNKWVTFIHLEFLRVSWSKKTILMLIKISFFIRYQQRIQATHFQVAIQISHQKTRRNLLLLLLEVEEGYLHILLVKDNKISKWNNSNQF